MPNQITALLVATSVIACHGALPSSALAQAPSTETVAGSEQTIVPRPIEDAAPPLSGETVAPRLTGESLRGLFAETGEDLRRLPSAETATILSIGAAGAAFGRSYDAHATRSMSTSRDMAAVFGAGQTLGSSQVQAAAAVATYALGRVTGHSRMTRVGTDLISAQIVTQITTTAIKVAAGRTRPDGSGFSFPSGHTATTFATATVLQRHFGWKVGIPAYAAAAYVAASRIQVKRHYLSDVAFGAALGVVAGRTVTVGRGDARFAVGPAATPGGAAVNFTWLGRP